METLKLGLYIMNSWYNKYRLSWDTDYNLGLKVRVMFGNLANPADFSCNLYQPELNANRSEHVHHREDHNHLLKRIIGCLREGLIPGIDLRFMREALHDGSTGLTYEALTGKNKQSVPDCKRVISCNVVSFLERKVQYR